MNTIASILNDALAGKSWIIKTCHGLPDGLYEVKEVRVDQDDSLVLYVGDFALRLRNLAALQLAEFKPAPKSRPEDVTPVKATKKEKSS